MPRKIEYIDEPAPFGAKEFHAAQQELACMALSDEPEGWQYTIYCDGSCWPTSGGPGGYAAILLLNGERIGSPVAGSFESTTNNRAEITALIKGLEMTPKDAHVEAYTDSQYLQRGCMWWRAKWQRKDWKNVKNDDLWRILNRLLDERSVNVKWIRGHNGNALNEEVDRLAGAQRKKVLCQQK